MNAVNRILGEDVGEEASRKAYIRAMYVQSGLLSTGRGRLPLPGQEEIEKRITHPEYIYMYATNVLKGRFKMGESVILRNLKKGFLWPTRDWARLYAMDVIKGRWPEVEPYFLESPQSSYFYAKYVIDGRWPEAEPILASSNTSAWAVQYAKHVLGRRFIEAEPNIATSRWRDEYLEEFPDASDDWIMNGWIDWLDT